MKTQSIILIATMLVCQNFWLKAQKPIPFELTKSGHIKLEASVDGVKGKFIFDTGAGVHVVSRRYFELLNATISDSMHFTSFRHNGEPISMMLYQVDVIQIGDFKKSGPWIGVHTDFDSSDFDGLISLKLFEDQPFQVDIKRKQLFIADLPEGGSEIPLRLNSNRGVCLDAFIPAVFDQKHRVWVEFDTGSGFSPILAHSRFMRSSGIDSLTMEVKQRQNKRGEPDLVVFDRSKKIHFGVSGTEAGGFPTFIFKQSLIYDGLVSHAIFGNNSWGMDIPQARMILYK